MRLVPSDSVASCSGELESAARATGTNSASSNRVCVPRAKQVSTCIGSLKTEEKTERQCGQQRIDNGASRGRTGCCLSIHKSTGPNPWQIKSDLSAGTPVFPGGALSSTSIDAVARAGSPGRTAVHGFVGEFDPGSGRTLAACLTHASRTRSMT